MPLVLGGDHSIAAGAAAGVAAHLPQEEETDWLHLARCPRRHEHAGIFASGNVHGMPLAAIMGYGAPELVELLGFKPKVEPQKHRARRRARPRLQERRLVKKSGVHVFTMRDIDERGMREVMADA